MNPGSPPSVSLLDGVRELGFDVESLAELRLSGRDYRRAVPVLIAGLDDVADDRELTEIVRALSVPWASPSALPSLIELFRSVDDPTGLAVRWTIGNTLEVLWDDRYFDELVDLAGRREFGRAREMVVLGLARSGRPETTAVLLELCDDADVNGHAVRVLARKTLARRVPEQARHVFERMSGDPRAWVRAAASRGLRQLS